jgi:hypothetical protein
VFGERGALLEHWVFRLFYNWPLTLRRRMRRRAELRASLPPRTWHAGPCALLTATVLGFASYSGFAHTGHLPALKEQWWLVLVAALLCGAAISLGSRGAALGRRIVTAAACGALTGAAATLVLEGASQASRSVGIHMLIAFGVWRVFILTILSTIGAVIAELILPEPEPR